MPKKSVSPTNLLAVGPGCGDMCTMLGSDESPAVHVSGSEDGARALAALRDGSYDIILLDASLPDMSGYDLCREIRKSAGLKPAQIIFLSDKVGIQNIRKMLESGGDDFIRKPVTECELRARIQAAVIRLRSQNALIQEREYYRSVVRQEEELSTKILDQTIHLKRAYRNIESTRRELEKSNRELEQIARYDSLSGLLNRSSLFAMLDIEIEVVERSGRPLSAIMIDIDHFKAINDNCGHRCGDMVIELVGEKFRERLRQYDLAGRYGGDEFLVALPDTDGAKAAIIAERFLGNLRSTRLEHDGTRVSITASMGVAEYINGELRDDWIRRADSAMYRAKENGRNGVVVD